MSSDEALRQSIAHGQIVKYTNVSSMTLLILDWLINLEPEIRLVWSSRWGYGKWLYLLCRYVSFFDIPFVLYHSLAANISPKQCQTLFMIITILTLITISAAESVLVLRTYALWNCDRRFLISLTTLWTIFAFTSLCISLTLTPTIRYAAQPVPSLPGCFPIAGSKVLSVNHGLVAIFETIIVTLTVYRGLTHFRGSNSHLVRVLYRDGITYFVLIFLCSVINVVIRLAFNRPYEMVWLVGPLQRVLHSNLTTRLILNARQVGETRMLGQASFSLTRELNYFGDFSDAPQEGIGPPGRP